MQSGEIAQRRVEGGGNVRLVGGPAELANVITFKATEEPQAIWSLGDVKVSANSIHPHPGPRLLSRRYARWQRGNRGRRNQLPFYPECDTAFLDDENVTDAPIRIFHGVGDDYVSLPRCRSYVERLRKAGKNVALTEYADAHHVFDGAQFMTPLKLPDAQTTRNCRLEEIADGIVVNSQTKQRFTYNDPCVERGATVAYQEEAHKASVQAVKEVLGTNLKVN